MKKAGHEILVLDDSSICTIKMFFPECGVLESVVIGG